MTHTIYLTRILGLLLLSAVLACSKQKLDFVPEHLADKADMPLSNVRIIDLFGFNQVRANGEYITNAVPPIEGEVNTKVPGTKYFPFDGRFGNLWFTDVQNWDGKDIALWQIPQELFRKDKSLSLDFLNLNIHGDIVSIHTHALEDTGEPMDYYIAPYGQPDVITPVRRETSPPKQGHFKIRILNFTTVVPPFSFVDGIEDVYGPLSLTYSDGTLVDPKINAIPTGRASEYIELPYGTYQFKLQTAEGNQVPGSNNHNTYKYINLPTNTIAFSYAENSNMPYIPISYYAPGGVYTLAIAPLGVGIFTWDNKLKTHFQNLFTLIEDVRPQANTQFARIQAFNALWQDDVSFWINGIQLAEKLDFGTATAYEPIRPGDYLIEVKDAAGQLLSKQQYTIRANQNLTVWAYPQEGKNATVLIQTNDLSDYRYARHPLYGSSADNGYYNARMSNFPFEIRYLNLCPDISYLSITNQDGMSVTAASNTASNALRPGELINTDPYMSFGTSYNMDRFKGIKAYRATPQINPGTWIESIASLASQDFITNKQQYIKQGKALPNHEHGIFSVAVIGSTDAQYANTKFKARFALLRHIK